MGAPVTGTFTGTGQSSVIYARHVDIALDFAGTASVDIERRMPDGTSRIKIQTAITADNNYIAEYPSPVALRLNCTAHTDNVTYLMQSGPQDQCPR